MGEDPHASARKRVALRPGRVLVMDDEMRWRDFIADILSSAGFAVDTVATRREAAEMLASRLYHLLVLDIRMQSDDPTNEDGMDLLRDLHRSDLGAAFAVILCSGYGSFAQMREASFVLHAADFLDKGSFHEELFLERVRELFSQILKIQLGLRIHWRGGLTARDAVLHLRDSDGRRVQRGLPLQQLLAEELEDLFCRLFLNFESLIVEATEDGLRSGNGVLVVKTFSPREDSHWAVVGDPRRISSVVAENGRPVQIDARIGRYDRTDVGRTPRLGGIVYTFADEKEDEIFSAFLAERFRL